MALYLGDPTAKLAGRLTLNPVPHLDPLGSFIVPMLTYFLGGFVIGWAKPVPYNPYNLKAGKWGPSLVAAAGPASNLLVATLFASVWRLGPALGLSGAFLEITVAIVMVNVALAVINLIPVPPIDGSKILFAILPYQWRGVEQFIRRYQFIILILLIFFALDYLFVPISFVARLLLGA